MSENNEEFSDFTAMVVRCRPDESYQGNFQEEKWVVIVACHSDFKAELWQVKEFLDNWDSLHPLNTMFVRLKEPWFAHIGYILTKHDFKEENIHD